MQNEHLRLYNINIKYIRDLSKADDKVLSVSPQTGKENRPLVGIIVICGKKEYCIPLSSPKSKHERMKNDKDLSSNKSSVKLSAFRNILSGKLTYF